MGLRVDLALVDGRTGEARWVDATSVNAAGITCRDVETNYLANRHANFPLSISANLPAPPGNPSPALMKREKSREINTPGS